MKSVLQPLSIVRKQHILQIDWQMYKIVIIILITFNGNYGSKIKRALELQAEGIPIQIITEKQLFDALNMLKRK